MLQSIATLSVNKVAKKLETSAEHDRNACPEGSLLLMHGKTWWSIQEICFSV